jgi:hypothetical protein
MLKDIVHGRCDLRILLANPKAVAYREEQEQQSHGEISKEVETSLAYRMNIGIRRESIRLYSYTPIVFAVATSNGMLLNHIQIMLRLTEVSQSLFKEP